MRRAALVLATALAVAGCGGSSRLSRHEFDAKGNAICAKYNAKQKQVANPRNLSELGPALRKLLPLAHRQAAELSKLKPPKGDDAAWKRLLGNVRRETDFVETQLVPAAEAKNLAKIRSLLLQLQQIDQQNNDAARALGLTTCATRAG